VSAAEVKPPTPTTPSLKLIPRNLVGYPRACEAVIESPKFLITLRVLVFCWTLHFFILSSHAYKSKNSPFALALSMSSLLCLSAVLTIALMAQMILRTIPNNQHFDALLAIYFKSILWKNLILIRTERLSKNQ